MAKPIGFVETQSSSIEDNIIKPASINDIVGMGDDITPSNLDNIMEDSVGEPQPAIRPIDLSQLVESSAQSAETPRSDTPRGSIEAGRPTPAQEPRSVISDAVDYVIRNTNDSVDVLSELAAGIPNFVIGKIPSVAVTAIAGREAGDNWEHHVAEQIDTIKDYALYLRPHELSNEAAKATEIVSTPFELVHSGATKLDELLKPVLGDRGAAFTGDAAEVLTYLMVPKLAGKAKGAIERNRSMRANAARYLEEGTKEYRANLVDTELTQSRALADSIRAARAHKRKVAGAEGLVRLYENANKFNEAYGDIPAMERRFALKQKRVGAGKSGLIKQYSDRRNYDVAELRTRQTEQAEIDAANNKRSILKRRREDAAQQGRIDLNSEQYKQRVVRNKIKDMESEQAAKEYLKDEQRQINLGKEDARKASADALQREYDTRNQMYEELFSEENSVEFVKDVENFIDRNGTKLINAKDLNQIVDNYIERMANSESMSLEFAKDAADWRLAKLELEARGLEPAINIYETTPDMVGSKVKTNNSPVIEEASVFTRLPENRASLNYELAKTDNGIYLPRDEYTPRTDAELSAQQRIRQLKIASAKRKTTMEKATPTENAFVELADALKEEYEITKQERTNKARDKNNKANNVEAVATKEEVGTINIDDTIREGEPLSAETLSNASQTIQPQGNPTVGPVREVVDAKAEVIKTKELVDDSLVEARVQALKDIGERRKAKANEGKPKDTNDILEDMRDLETDEYYNPREPVGKSPFEKSLDSSERNYKDTLDDLVDLMDEMYDPNRIGMGLGGLKFDFSSAKAKAAASRIQADVLRWGRNAGKLGIKLGEYLEGVLRFPKKVAAALSDFFDVIKPKHDIQKFYARVNKNESVRRSVNVYNYYLESDKAGKSASRRKRIANSFKRTGELVVDPAGKLKNLLDRTGDPEALMAVREHAFIQGAGGRAAEYSTNIKKAVYEGLSLHERQVLDFVLRAKRDITLRTMRKNYGGKNAFKLEDYQAFLDDIDGVTGLSDKSINRIMSSADTYFSAFRDLLQRKYDEGVITKKAYEKMKDYEYMPTKYLQFIDESLHRGPGKQMVDVKETGVKRLQGGKDAYVNMDSEQLLTSAIMETESLIAKNRANQSLFKLALARPENGFVTIPHKLRSVNNRYGESVPQYAKPDAGYKELNLYVDGVPEKLHMPDWMADQWVASAKEMSPVMQSIVRWSSGSNIIKFFATGPGAPLFALANFPLDMAHAYLVAAKQSGEHLYSPNLFKYGKEIATDLSEVARDAWTKKGAYNDYVQDGGGMHYLSGQSKLITKGDASVTRGLQKMENTFSKLNEFSEIAMRLAIRNRALKQGMTRGEASYAARTYLDFSQGGSLTKAIDTAIPYTNVMIQATRGLARSAKRNPKVFAQKAAWLAASQILFDLSNTAINEEAYNQVSEHDKARHFIITTPFEYEDENGETRHLYFKVRKDPAQSFITAAASLMTHASMGNDKGVKEASRALWGNMTIADTIPMPPTIAAISGYTANFDWLTLKKIWGGSQGIEPSAEWDKYINDFYRRLGDNTGMSPARMQYVAKSIIGRNNPMANMMGAGWSAMFDDLKANERDTIMTDVIRELKVSKVVGLTHPANEYREEFNEIATEDKTNTHIRNKQLDLLAEAVEYGTANTKDVTKYIAQQPVDKQDALITRYMNHKKLYGIPNRAKWLSIMALPSTDAKAKAFNEWYSSAGPEELTDIKRGLIGSGLDTDEFFSALMKLRAQ